MLSSGHDMATALMNSGQLRLPAQTLAHQHSSTDEGEGCIRHSPWLMSYWQLIAAEEKVSWGRECICDKWTMFQWIA